MGHPILDEATYRRDIPEARALEERVASMFHDAAEARRLAETAGIAPASLDTSGPPSTAWANILDQAARQGRLAVLLGVLEGEAPNALIKDAIAAVRGVQLVGGSLHAGTRRMQPRVGSPTAPSE